MSAIGVVCPICGSECGFREIAPYYREVRELWPPRSGMVPVARFQCRGLEGKFPTFSLLPWQLVPRHRYTLRSMVLAILLWCEYWRDPEESGTGYRVEQSLSGESRVTAWQLRCWVVSVGAAFARDHSEVSAWYDFSEVPFGGDVLDVVYGYFEAVSRGPPDRGEGVISFIREYAKRKGRFFWGRGPRVGEVRPK